MYKIKGLSVSSGIAIGKARLIKEKDLVIQDYRIEEHQIEAELEQFKASITAVIKEIDEFVKNFELTKADADIIETHKMILQDPDFHITIENLITSEKRNLEHAVYLHFSRTIDFFKNLDNEFYAERATDYDDVYRRLIRHLRKIDTNVFSDVKEGDIVVINELPPSMVSDLYNHKVEGVILFKGTRTSHSVIIARAYGLPIITAIKYIHQIHENDLLIIDAKKGFILGNPDAKTIQEFEELKNKIDKETKELQKYKEIKTTISDEERIMILSNIELPVEVGNVLEIKSDGIGLFRTEFFYLNRAQLPSDDEQYFEYKTIAEKLNGKVFVIRTIDIGGDKVAGWYSAGKEANPYLGCRGIRFSLKFKTIFKTQLKAILRASAFGNVHIMFPMIATVEEFLEAKEVLEECKDEFRKIGVAFNENIPVGTMIEVPSAALCSEALAQYSDFFSIGTNDLLQYTVAVDRNNDSITKYYNPYNPAFLQLVYKTIKSGVKHGKPVAVCGELAADRNFTTFLIASGVRELSVGIDHTLFLRKHIADDSNKWNREMDLSEIENCFTVDEVVDYLKKLNG
jgi:phosphotransferase system enzyme I (PtsI)